MSSRYRRHPRESLLRAGRRIAAFALALILSAGLWWVVRPSIIYQLACANLGNYRAEPLIERALVERHPQIAWRPAVLDRIHMPWRSHLVSFDSGRRRFAIASPSGASSFGGDAGEWLLFDGRLDLLGSIGTANAAFMAPDDRDGDGTIELLLICHFAASGSFRTFHCVARFGRERHALLAVVEQSTTAALPAWSWPMWTNSDKDSQHELEWVSYAAGPGGTGSMTSALKLRWLAPGRMTCDGPLPAAYKVWLAETPDQVTFRPEESLNDVARRVLDQ